jgi:pimeloyl-ACP methyl ester carboxylesterase
VSLGYDRDGSGAPLVLIHGLGADRHVWAPVMPALARTRDVIAIDMPGFGETSSLTGDGRPSPAALAERIAAELTALGIDRPHVAGNSLGGWVALELALLGAVRSVTAIAPAGLWARPLGPKPNVARRIGGALLPLMPALMRSSTGRRLALAGSVGDPDRVPPEDAVQLIRAYVKAPGFTAVNGAMRSGRFERLDDVSVPLLFGWPDRDRLVSRPRRLPEGSRSVTLENCGHIPMWDDPGQVIDLLLDGSARPGLRDRAPSPL